MLKHYIVITWRNIRNNKVFTLINIFGLSIGLACTFIIWLWIKYEVSYDKFNVNKNRLYKVSYQNSSYILPAPLAKYLSGEFPEIKYATVYQNLNEVKLTIEDKGYYSNGVFANETFFKMFSFPLLEGDKESVFTNPNSIVITQSLAKKFFGNENPIGKTIQLVDQWNMTVTGVLKNLPSNTQFQFEFLIPYDVLPEQVKNNWNVNSLNIYVLLANGSSYIEVNKKIVGVTQILILKFFHVVCSDVSTLPGRPFWQSCEAITPER